MVTKKKKYQEIYENLEIDDYIFEGHLDDVIERLQALKTQYDKHTFLHLDLNTSDDNVVEVSLRGRRPETNRERDDRLAASRVLKEANVERKQHAVDVEKAEFFRLVEKYGHLL